MTDILSYIEFSENNNQDIINEKYSSGSFFVEGDTDSILIDDNIWTMNQNTYLLNNTFEYPTNFYMSVGFWIKPINDGLIKDTISDQLISFYKSLFGFEMLDDQFNTTYLFAVSERVETEGNRLIITLYGETDNSYIESELYVPGVWHYILIEFLDITSGNINIYIDGNESQTIKIEGEYPTIVPYVTYCHYTWNKMFETSYGYVRNNADIKNICVINGILPDFYFDLQHLINYDIESIITGNVSYEDTVFLYNDVSTKTINSILSQKSNYLVGTNYGKIYESILQLWNVKNNLYDITDTNNFYVLSNNINYEINNGFFILREGSISDL